MRMAKRQEIDKFGQKNSNNHYSRSWIWDTSFLTQTLNKPFINLRFLKFSQKCYHNLKNFWPQARSIKILVLNFVTLCIAWCSRWAAWDRENGKGGNFGLLTLGICGLVIRTFQIVNVYWKKKTDCRCFDLIIEISQQKLNVLSPSKIINSIS